LSDEVRRLVDSGVAGFSVTTPHKESIMSLLDEVDPVARTIGAVNCVAVHGGRLVGYNTDWSGLAHSLEPHSAALDSCPALVVGTGGAARATIYTLWKAFDVGEVPVDLELGGRTVVNCTPLGGPKFPELTPFSEAFDWSSVGLYCDLNYNRDNKLLAAALNAACPVVDGSQMLVAQALDAYEIWTGHRARISETYQKVFGVGRG
jgi:shikimate dehydrogenase